MARVSIGVLVAAMLAACGGARDDGVPYAPYPTPDAALAALRTEATRSIAALAPATPRLGGRALIVLPDDARIEAAGIRRPVSAKLKPESRDFLIEAMQIGVIANVEALRRGQVFDSLEVVGDADPAAVPMGAHDFKVWLLADSPDDWRWFVVRNGVDGRAAVAIETGSDKDVRLSSFNAGVVEAAIGLGAAALPAR